MREIKFRCWDVEKKEMDMHAHNRAWFGPTVSNTNHHNHTLYKVMQYTGLKDKNGVEIYEGDVVLDAHGNKQKVEIGPVFHATWEDTFAGYGFGFDTHSLYDFTEKVEVIGNIYQDSHLLKTDI